MNKKRENGFYWVMNGSYRWIVCEFHNGFWSHQGCSYNDENFREIDERIIIRENKVINY